MKIDIPKIREQYRVGTVDYSAAIQIKELCDEIERQIEMSARCGLAISHGMECPILAEIKEKE